MKNKTKGAAQKDGGAVNEKDPAAAAKQIEKLGAAKGGDKKGDQSATHLDYEGSPRMGYTQNFGAARQGGYAKGAAKVNSIMKGAAQNERSGRLKPDYSNYEAQLKLHGITEGPRDYNKYPEVSTDDVNERSGTRFPGVRGGLRNPETFIKSHPNFISKETWENVTDEQKDINQG